MTTDLNVDPKAQPSAGPSLIDNRAFMVILVATSLSSVGLAMFDTGSAWLMTSLNPSPRLVSAVQVASTLPLFLLTLPAGALTDVVDPRRLLIVAQVGMVVISVAFAALVSAGLASPLPLLSTSFLLGLAGALAAPAWMLITPILVPRSELDTATAIDTSAYNVARAVGPAIAGYAIAGLSIAVPFWCCCAGNLVLLTALVWWRAPRRPKETLPAERLISAMTAGLRYVRYSRDMDATVIRAIAFFPFSSAYLALLPLVARSQKGGAEVYGGLMAAIGLGSIAATFALPWLKSAARPERAGRARGRGDRRRALSARRGARAGDGARRQLRRGRLVNRRADHLFCLGAGGACRNGCAAGAWRSFSPPISARSRGQRRLGRSRGGQGSALRPRRGGRGALIGTALTWAWKLQSGAAQDLTPSMRWRAPSFLNRVADDQGPILVDHEYRIDPKDIARLPRRDAGHQSRAQARRRLRLAYFRRPGRPGQVDRNLPHPLHARTQVSPDARDQG